MIAFVCASYIQTIRAFQMHSQIDGFKQNADLFLVNKMFEDVELISRFRKTRAFNNVHYIDTSADETAATLRYMYAKKYKDILKKNSYSKVISFNEEEIIAQALYNLNKRQPNFEFHCVEDAPSAYELYLPPNFSWKHPYKWLGIDKPFYKIKEWWTSCPELMTFPKECNFEVKKLPPINVNDRKLLDIVNYIYDYKADENLNKVDCLIMEESHYTDGLMIDNKDYEIYEKIVKRYPDIKFAIKLHPRTRKNRFEGLVSSVQNMRVPWELIAWNRMVSNDTELFQLGIICGTMVSDKLLFGYEGSKMLLAKVFKGLIRAEGGYCRISDALIQKYERFQQEYKQPDKFVLPCTEEEVFRILDKKWKNGHELGEK